MTRKVDLLGRVFGRLTVIAEAPNRIGRTAWYALCSCGKTVWVIGNSLLRGQTSSCGCYHREITRLSSTKHKKHGMCFTPTWRSWHSMVQRCSVPSYANYDRYGGVGITVCEQWLEFAGFYADMGNRPAGTTLDRIKGDKGYEPGNCRWATPTTQSRNRSFCRLVTYRGETKCVSQWCEELSLPVDRIYRRLEKGFTPEEAFFPGKFPTTGRPAIARATGSAS